MAENAPPQGIEADESPQLDKLAAALSKAQGAITNAPKDHEAKVKMKDNKGEYRYRYATLDGIWDAARAALSANDLAVIQCPTLTAEGVLLTTTLLHGSGQFVRTRLLWPVVERTAQGIGSAITYARRYSLAPLVGVVTEEDDDGSAASGRDAETGAPEEPVPTTFPPFGKAKGQPIPGASIKELEWYASAMRESVADPDKARFKAKNAAMLAAIEAELARQRAVTPEGQRETKSEPKKPAVVDQQAGESEDHAKMRNAGAFYAQAVKDGISHGWSQEDVGKWLRKERGRGGKSEVTAEDVEIFLKHLGPPQERQPGEDA